jgi:hypothetical protein
MSSSHLVSLGVFVWGLFAVGCGPTKAPAPARSSPEPSERSEVVADLATVRSTFTTKLRGKTPAPQAYQDEQPPRGSSRSSSRPVLSS